MVARDISIFTKIWWKHNISLCESYLVDSFSTSYSESIQLKSRNMKKLLLDVHSSHSMDVTLHSMHSAHSTHNHEVTCLTSQQSTTNWRATTSRREISRQSHWHLDQWLSNYSKTQINTLSLMYPKLSLSWQPLTAERAYIIVHSQWRGSLFDR